MRHLDRFKEFDQVNESLLDDFKSLGSKIKEFSSDVLSKLKEAFTDTKDAIKWLKKMIGSGVSTAAISLIITTMASCNSPERMLKTWTNPKFIEKMKNNDPKYFKMIYFETKDSTGKPVYKIRKQWLRNPAYFGSAPNESYRGKSCLEGGFCPTYK